MESAWRELDRRISNCYRCKNITGSRSIPVRGIGSHEAWVMIVGLAPGKDGADLTGIPFTRDPSGQLIDEMLSVAGLSREQDVFITNIVKCNPKDEKGRNRTPSKEEIENCLQYLKCELDYLKPRIIVTLGKEATEFLLNTNIDRMSDFHGRKMSKDGMFFFPFFHPGYLIRGAYGREKYLEDFRVLGDIFHDLIEEESKMSRLDILLMVLAYASDGVSRGLIRGKTKMQKLLFLVQNELRKQGYKAKYAFRPYLYGPYSLGLHTDIEWLRMNDLVKVRTAFDEKVGLMTEFIITEKGKDRLNNLVNYSLHKSVADTVKLVVEKYDQLNVGELVDFVHKEYPAYDLNQRKKDKKQTHVKLDNFL